MNNDTYCLIAILTFLGVVLCYGLYVVTKEDDKPFSKESYKQQPEEGENKMTNEKEGIEIPKELEIERHRIDAATVVLSELRMFLINKSNQTRFFVKREYNAGIDVGLLIAIGEVERLIDDMEKARRKIVASNYPVPEEE